MTDDAGPHRASAEEVVAALDTDEATGLSTEEARRRLAAHGPNELPGATGNGLARRFLRQLTDPLVVVLLAAGAVTTALGQYVDAGVVLGVVLLNAVIGTVQESRAEQALAALARMTTGETAVVRDGRTHRVPVAEVVPGDVVVLAAGDRVPADLRLVRVSSLEADESALTGESVPVAKSRAPLAEAAVVADRVNMAYSGTLVTRGAGRGVVVATGTATELGETAALVGSAAPAPTPLTRKLTVFSRRLTAVIVVLAVLTFLVGLLRGLPAAEVFTGAVALAVGAIPEGLPAAVTIVLAIGVVRMARRNAVVRRLPAVETLGSTTVICTDKTGTLTANEMTVTAVHAEDEHARAECLRAGVLCNDAELTGTLADHTVLGDPTEGALLVSALEAGVLPAVERERAPRVAVLPFDSGRQLMATVHREPDGSHTAYVKGSVERVLAACVDQLGADGVLDPERVHRCAEELAGVGLRVLAFARRTGATPSTVDEEPLRGLTFLGLQAMHDPPRPEAITAVAACRRAGVEVKMVTGDHLGTARAIAAAFGLGAGAVTGAEIEGSTEDELARTAVFARVSPEQKLRLVELLQRRGHVVAMTGDGVNDAPALRQADIGIAMGKMGTEVAKEAADMVLTDDNFAAIGAAVEEGRGVFDNLRKFIAWTLPTNLAEGLVILVAVLAGTVLPILPVQILWINMTTAVFLGLTLAFEPREPGAMLRPPRPPERPLLTGDLVRRIVLISAVLVAGAFGVFWHLLASGVPLTEARTAAVTVFVLVQVVYLFACRSLDRLRASGRNPWLLGGIALMFSLQALITYVPALNTVFHTAPLTPAAWLPVLVVTAVAHVVVTVDKLFWRPRARRTSLLNG
ncbi:cation-transporting ATPase F [Crossiella equi]|uniref:Cation-transporting ATPase F n=1 Tax=Crossiella equi TaxID=130796 RepID=A0ABS5ATD7_9PSEU|nr:HAD-IC family P-type ATPase [Crossiella equi]MBP2479522.1 cation-transporting ATPase F [Crossiella equi]